MSAHAATDTIRRWYDATNRKDLDAMGACVTDDFVSRYLGAEGRDAYLRSMQGFFEAFPDLEGEVLEAVSDGNVVAANVRLTGTHQGEFNGIPATGKRVELEATDWARIAADGRLAEHWAHADNLAMMQQLGVIPE